MTDEEMSWPGDVPLDGLEWSTLDRYFSGTCAPEECRGIEAWAARSQTHADELMRLRRLWMVAAHGTSRFDADAAWRRVRGRVEERAVAAVGVGVGDGAVVTRGRGAGGSLRGRRTLPRWTGTTLVSTSRALWIAAGIAATVLAIVLSGLREPTWHPHPVPSQTYATSARQRTTVVLLDGSRVTLAPQTTLTVSAGFGRDNRLVRLDGHAYFDIAHTAGRPFTVQTGRVATRVLGTAFDIVHYGDDREVRLVVISGKVAMTTSRRVVTLVPGMMGRVTDSTTLVTAVDDITSYQAWTHGPLEFRNVPVRDVLQAVGHWYGLRFTLTDTTLAAQRITTFLDYASTRDLIAALETVLGVTATSSTTVDGQVVTLRPRLQTVRPVPRRREGLETFSFHSEVGR